MLFHGRRAAAAQILAGRRLGGTPTTISARRALVTRRISSMARACGFDAVAVDDPRDAGAHRSSREEMARRWLIRSTAFKELQDKTQRRAALPPNLRKLRAR